MQFVSAMMDPDRAAREKPVGAHLPWSHQVDNHTIATQDGRLMQFIRVAGLAFETADSDDLNYRAELRDAMLRALGNSSFAITHQLATELGYQGEKDGSAEMNIWLQKEVMRQLATHGGKVPASMMD